jgi:hypothetical protein
MYSRTDEVKNKNLKSIFATKGSVTYMFESFVCYRNISISEEKIHLQLLSSSLFLRVMHRVYIGIYLECHNA